MKINSSFLKNICYIVVIFSAIFAFLFFVFAVITGFKTLEDKSIQVTINNQDSIYNNVYIVDNKTSKIIRKKSTDTLRVKVVNDSIIIGER